MPKPKKIRKITIELIPHEQQRYETLGDWFYTPDDELVIRTSRTDYSFNEEFDWPALAIAFHELCEVLICNATGVTQEQVDKFDKNNLDADEPGDLPDAPYAAAHCFATAVERMLIAAMGKTWSDYEDILAEVDK